MCSSPATAFKQHILCTHTLSFFFCKVVSDRRFSTSQWAECWVIKQLFKLSLEEWIGGGDHGKMTQHELITQFINWLKLRWSAAVFAAASCTAWHPTSSCLAWPHERPCTNTHTSSYTCAHTLLLLFIIFSLSLLYFLPGFPTLYFSAWWVLECHYNLCNQKQIAGLDWDLFVSHTENAAAC